jgi:neurofibromin 1
MTKRTARVIFYLSASNWPLVLSRIKARVAHLTTTLEENPELFELRFLEWANVDATRLAQALQEISTPFLHVKRPAQTALASALRKAIWNWIDVYPAEYQALIEGTRKLDGNPDVLFDVLLSMSDSSSTNKRAKVFYPLMAMLLVLSPDSLKRLALGDVSRGGSALAKKHSFLDSLRKGLSQSKSFEACAVCYVDLVRAAMCCSPRLETSGIRTLAPDLQNDLKVSKAQHPWLTTERSVLLVTGRRDYRPQYHRGRARRAVPFQPDRDDPGHLPEALDRQLGQQQDHRCARLHCAGDGGPAPAVAPCDRWSAF